MKRKKLISDKKKKKIQAFLKELNNIKSPYNFILERLKDFCRLNLNQRGYLDFKQLCK